MEYIRIEANNGIDFDALVEKWRQETPIASITFEYNVVPTSTGMLYTLIAFYTVFIPDEPAVFQG